MRTGTLLGYPIVVNSTWLVIFALLIVSLVTSLSVSGTDRLAGAESLGVGAIVVVLFIGSILAHELAHAVVARRRGVQDPRIRLLTPGGTETETPPESPGTELLVAGSGLLVSVLIATGSLALSQTVPADASETALLLYWTAWWLGLANLVLTGFHLMPTLPLDGGRLVRALAMSVTRDTTRATRVAGLVGRTFGYGLVGAGLILVAVSSEIFVGIWLVLLGWFAGRLARLSVERQRLGDLTAGMTVADVVDSDIPSVPGALTLDTLLTQDARERGSAGVYTILDGDRVAGILETASLRRSIWGRQGERRVAEVASPLAEVHGLPPGAPLIRAVEQFEAERTDVVVVVEPVQPPRLVGVIRRAAVLERLSARQALADGRDRAAPDGPGG